MSSITSQFKKFVKSNKYDVKTHQTEGFNWCYRRETLTKTHGGGLLCDEMGLGKTLLMIACMKLNPQNNTLIVVPKSLIGQWREKIKLLLGKTPQLYHGSSAKAFLYNNDKSEQKEIMSKKIFLTTYGMLKSVLAEVRWERIIYDEAHNMREKKTRVFKNAMKLDGKIKWMVTGTPVQNSWNDVLSLCKLLNFPEGRELFVKGADVEDQRDYIQDIMLVRTKDEINIKMPALNVIIEKVEPSTKEERSLLTDIHNYVSASKVVKTLEYPVVGEIGQNALTYLLRAKQSCSYPKMVEKCIKKAREDSDRDDNMPNFLTMSTSKLTKVVDTIEKHNRTIKKLVFYTFNAEMNFIKDSLQHKGYSVGIVNGKTNVKKKNSILASTNYDVLLVQIKSGSDGLNLQQYGQVYFVSPHWNPAVEQQAIARIYRIGQLASKVDVFYFITTFDKVGTYTLDEYCMEIKRTKQETIDFLFNNEDNNLPN